ncbi:MAG TPA: acyl-CoA dehydrogenase family protein [Ferrovibrio sp.]|jgi:acyl-CoA dehydrogenase|uniref:acyl-CoA dehydrogenase family protein n=1 Tax=Ferrovibrio sp. TaxID=1917215 RepID=UPI002B4B70C4|nr:acyl-CoA dehydrogenase family protein [Ferrovibrio sp.]HLT77384.1 acyl-CoA dehydrogenase family protein [Ferrovibrio sp.]
MTADTRTIVLDTARRIFAGSFPAAALRQATEGFWLAEQWRVLEEAGLPLALVDESAGGFGLDVAEALQIVRLAAAFAVPLPLAETMLANFLLTRAGLTPAEGPATIAFHPAASFRLGGSGRLEGSAPAVVWAGHVQSVVLLASAGDAGGDVLVRVRKGGWNIVETGRTLNGLPADAISVRTGIAEADRAPLPQGLDAQAVFRAGAAIRSIGLAGAMRRAVEMTASFVQERSQFGRPLSKFQVIQHDMARMLEQSAAAEASADMAADAFASGMPELPIAVAKARTSEAAGIVAGLAHQLHGAIGVTAEFPLHHVTRQLWAWRDEFGNEAFWNRRLGRVALNRPADDLWAFVTALETGEGR